MPVLGIDVFKVTVAVYYYYNSYRADEGYDTYYLTDDEEPMSYEHLVSTG